VQRERADKIVRDFSKEYASYYTFNQLSIWPDSLHSQKVETFTHWHYIDMPFSTDGTPLKNISDTDNVIWAIQLIKPIVQNYKANYYERARFLAFLEHIVGDIHQPLHTTARISAMYPDGDQGGNLFSLKYPAQKPQTISLHRLWDQGFDLFTGDTSSENIARLSTMITASYPKSYFGEKVFEMDPVVWGNEGFAISTGFVYSTSEKSAPTSTYISAGTEIVKQQIALAGYRLANVLNELLKDS
ncbi:MAG TPA: S1/P1 nuclease, partial [Gammaproteobacteria bacterium]|nr:S1/P1 nuclease [Gammaproteobacteria bacterium]